jgi:4-hydroxy-3-polyprenylbenzoate decarboxylase
VKRHPATRVKLKNIKEVALMAYKHYKDNREFIKALHETGDLVTIEQEVDWDMELGAIVRRACEKNSPAPYFKKIKDYPAGRALAPPCPLGGD